MLTTITHFTANEFNKLAICWQHSPIAIDQWTIDPMVHHHSTHSSLCGDSTAEFSGGATKFQITSKNFLTRTPFSRALSSPYSSLTINLPWTRSPVSHTLAWPARWSKRSAVSQTFPISGLRFRFRAHTLYLAGLAHLLYLWDCVLPGGWLGLAREGFNLPHTNEPEPGSNQDSGIIFSNNQG